MRWRFVPGKRNGVPEPCGTCPRQLCSRINQSTLGEFSWNRNSVSPMSGFKATLLPGRGRAAAGHVAGIVDRHPDQALDIIKFKSTPALRKTSGTAKTFAAGMTKLAPTPPTPSATWPWKAIEATAHHRNTKAHLHDALDVSDWVTRCLRNCIDEFTARLQSGLAILASVGSPRRSSACSAPCGASTTRCWPSAPRASPPSTRWPAPSERR